VLEDPGLVDCVLARGAEREEVDAREVVFYQRPHLLRKRSEEDERAPRTKEDEIHPPHIGSVIGGAEGEEEGDAREVVLHQRPYLQRERDWYFMAKQPAPAPHLARSEGRAALTYLQTDSDERLGRAWRSSYTSVLGVCW